MSLSWKLKRLSAMSRREIVDRTLSQLHHIAERCGMFRPTLPNLSSLVDGRPWVQTLPSSFDAEKYRAAADRVLRGEFDVFALKAAKLGFPPVWNRDPKTGRVAPMSFGKSLNYRDEHVVGDIKYLWEPSRHAELVVLAQAWHLTREARYANGCKVLLGSWIADCPYSRGAHWASSLEHAVRLLNWHHAWHLLGGGAGPILSQDPGFKASWLKSIYEHCWFIAGHLSRHSSANNHLLGELTGLFVASCTWPVDSRLVRWGEQAARELEQQVLLQNTSDGVNREQATWYHHEVADMMLVAGLAGRTNGRDFSPAYWQRLEAMSEFIASIMDAAGNVPAIGDADDARIAPLDPDEDVNVFRSLLATSAVLFKREDFWRKAGRLDDKTRWLLGDNAEAQIEERCLVKSAVLPRRAFPEAGYFILGQCFDTGEEVRIIADAGFLGYLSIAAHGHADALSFTMSVGGREFLIDPGTFAYHTERKWRNYFRGTSAHNTVRVDGQDQSVIGGNFLWLRHAQAKVSRFECAVETDCLQAEHDGYKRLDDPLVHRRTLQFDHACRRLQVTDDLICEGPHQIEIFWHFAQSCEVRHCGQEVIASRDGAQVVLRIPDGMCVNLVRGSETPPLGWRSEEFDVKAPTTTVVASAAIKGNARFITEFSIEVARARQTAGNRAWTEGNCLDVASEPAQQSFGVERCERSADPVCERSRQEINVRYVYE